MLLLNAPPIWTRLSPQMAQRQLTEVAKLEEEKKTAGTVVSMPKKKKKKSVIFTDVITLNPFNGLFSLYLLLCPGYSTYGSQCLQRTHLQ